MTKPDHKKKPQPDMDEVLKRMLSTPPDPKIKPRENKAPKREEKRPTP